MRKIATPTELDAALHNLLEANRQGATREELSAALATLSTRVAARSPDEWAAWIERTLSEPVVNVKQFAFHLAREKGSLPAKAQKLADTVLKQAKELDETIGQLIIALGD